MSCVESDSAFGPQNEEEELIFAEEAFRVDTQVKIHELMIRKGLSQRDLAERLKVSEARVSQFFSDKFNMTVRKLAKIFFVMGEVPKIETTPVERKSWARLTANSDAEDEQTLQGFQHISVKLEQAYCRVASERGSTKERGNRVPALPQVA
jgi:transcriptional regulator with XRE-family HTH domain